jgi:hypothetical protein
MMPAVWWGERKLGPGMAPRSQELSLQPERRLPVGQLREEKPQRLKKKQHLPPQRPNIDFKILSLLLCQDAVPLKREQLRPILFMVRGW